MKYILKIGIPVLIVAAIAIAALYISSKPLHIYEVQPVASDKAYANVLAILPNVKHSHHLDKIDNGTLFLLMKTDDKLFYITSFKQIASFGDKHKKITQQSPIYPTLYVGRYSEENNAIEYRSLKEAGVKTLVFKHKSIQKYDKEKLDSEGIVFKIGINTGAFLVKMSNNESRTLRIGSWPFSLKVISQVKLMPDKKNNIKADIKSELEKKPKK